MKVKAKASPRVATAKGQKKSKAAASAQTARAWKPEATAAASKKKLSTLATDAAVTVISTHQGPAEEASKHPLLARFGKRLGLGLGVIVTEALALVPKWNKPILDESGKPAASIPGAERRGNHDLLARHRQVVGPKVTALVEKMPEGAIRDLLEGFGQGATEAPGASYRLESAISDMFHKR